MTTAVAVSQTGPHPGLCSRWKVRSLPSAGSLLRLLLPCLILAGLTAGKAAGAPLTVYWDLHPRGDIVDYRLHYGFESRVYVMSTNLGSRVVSLGDAMSATVELPVPGFTYYMVLSAVSADGLESVFANEIVHTVPPGEIPLVPGELFLGTLEDHATDPFWVGTIDPQARIWILARPPRNGRVQGSGNQFVYVPFPEFYGMDSFRFFVLGDGPDIRDIEALVFIEGVEDPPIAFDLTTTTSRGQPVSIRLIALDADESRLTYTITQQPHSGTLSGQPPDVVYTPSPSFLAEDDFTYVVHDGSTNSNTGTVRILEEDPERGPTRAQELVNVSEDTPVRLNLASYTTADPASSYVITLPPRNGTLSGDPPNVTYTPVTNYFGQDLVQYMVFRPTGVGTEVSLLININPVNDAPAVPDATVSVIEGVPNLIQLTGDDVDEDPLTFQVVAPPRHGVLYGKPPYLLYEPLVGFSGSDQFRYRALDGTRESRPGTVRITVVPGTQAFPRIETRIDSLGRMVLVWRGIPGKHYRVLHKAGLATPEWTTIGTIAASTENLSWPVDMRLGTNGFYAVELTLP